MEILSQLHCCQRGIYDVSASVGIARTMTILGFAHRLKQKVQFRWRLVAFRFLLSHGRVKSIKLDPKQLRTNLKSAHLGLWNYDFDLSLIHGSKRICCLVYEGNEVTTADWKKWNSGNLTLSKNDRNWGIWGFSSGYSFHTNFILWLTFFCVFREIQNFENLETVSVTSSILFCNTIKYFLLPPSECLEVESISLEMFQVTKIHQQQKMINIHHRYSTRFTNIISSSVDFIKFSNVDNNKHWLFNNFQNQSSISMCFWCKVLCNFESLCKNILNFIDQTRIHHFSGKSTESIHFYRNESNIIVRKYSTFVFALKTNESGRPFVLKYFCKLKISWIRSPIVTNRLFDSGIHKNLKHWIWELPLNHKKQIPFWTFIRNTFVFTGNHPSI